MNLFTTIQERVHNTLISLMTEGKLPPGLDISSVVVETPRDPSHGDMATNAALVLTKAANLRPHDIATMVLEKLKAYDDLSEVSIAGPGFINIRLNNSLWQSLIPEIVKSGTHYGDATLGKGIHMNVEYVSANPTGPMHIGHARGAVFGDAIARLLEKAGYQVTREFYINDTGSQAQTLARSAFLRYREALGEHIGHIPAGYYPGEYLIHVGQELKERYGETIRHMPEDEWLPIVLEFAIDSMLVIIKSDLRDLGVEHDVFVSERRLHHRGLVDEAVKLLESKGLLYRGILEPPKGKAPEDWEPREQLLFKATQFGDDVDRPLQKSDGTWTYFASDIAYHLDKLQRGFTHMVLELGKDHGGYLKRMKAAVAALSDNEAEITILFHDLVKFMDNGEPVKMSKRSGTFTTVRDVLDSVDSGIVRFIMLTRKNDIVLEFDLAKVKEQSKDNPVFYVQYAHARTHSIFKKLPDAWHKEHPLNSLDKASLTRITDEAEITLLKKLGEWPKLIESSAKYHEPHRIAFYLYDLASLFHSLWNRGKEHEEIRFIIENDTSLTLARLALVKSVQIVIASGLEVLGVTPMDEMR